MDRPLAWNAERIDLSVTRPFRIGAADVDTTSHELRFGASTERLQPQNLKVLVALVRRKGDVVTRPELIDCCWDGRIVGEDVINHAISTLRQVASRAGGFSIQTVPKAGYRLVEQGAAKARRPRPLTIVAMLLVAAVAAVAIYYLFGRSVRQGEPPMPTMAVLPLEVIGNDAILRRTASATRSSVVYMLADTGFPVRAVDSRDRVSAADFIISGQIQRVGANLQATLYLEEARRRSIIFTRRFEAPLAQSADLPDRIGASTAANLSWTGALMILDRRYASNAVLAPELMRQLTMTIEAKGAVEAYEISRRIAPKAPNSAMAQLALAFNSAFALEQLPRDQREEAVRLARIAAERAERLAPEFGDVYIPSCLLYPQVRRVACEDRLRTGLKVHPGASFLASFTSGLMADVGRSQEALHFARAAYAYDPYKPAKLGRLIRELEINGRSAESRELYRKSKRLWPDDPRVNWARPLALIQTGQFDELARVSGEHAAAGVPIDRRLAAEIAASIRASDGERVRRACARPNPDLISRSLCVAALAQVGELDAAFRLADQLYPKVTGASAAEEERLWLDHPNIFFLGLLTSPSVAPLRSDPRFLAIASRTGLLDYWRSGRLPDFCTQRREPVCAAIRR